ncbi:MAG: 4-(cytidine 5'-diphospho)-2-C-methyl-D-erythritol kinase [Desulfobacterales bacterium]|nr:4-(cytidine 5'-diphospho)-2-C-methyl-D-erythritol kinase [Desulfobacterales bacterium]
MKLLSPAKINLFLRVLGRRSDGYHELETLMACIGLFDTVLLTVGDGPVTVCCRHPLVPENETNLAVKAARLFFRHHGHQGGVHIEIDKQIPVGAGLGGGSSNAATVLKGLNRHFGSPFSDSSLAEMALTLGADVPFFIFGRPALATGIGERLDPYPHLTRLPLVILYPGFAVSTATVYKNLNLGLTKDENQPKYFPLISGFIIESHLFNDLEAVTLQRHPEIAAAKTALVKNGALGALMSGSGSSVFGVFADTDSARRACKALSQRRGWRLFVAEILA